MEENKKWKVVWVNQSNPKIIYEGTMDECYKYVEKDQRVELIVLSPRAYKRRLEKIAHQGNYDATHHEKMQ